MRNRSLSGILALFGIGAFYLWRNRDRVRHFVDSIQLEQLGDEGQTDRIKRVLRTGVSRFRDRFSAESVPVRSIGSERRRAS